jgi:isoquinoline 1-oxidoreductase alpha subunit
MSAAALLAKTPKPTDDQINQNMTNICRCGTYSRIRDAVKRAAGISTPRTTQTARAAAE